MPTQSDNGGIDRTNLAVDRTVLANERTYSAWIRTGLAALAAGLGTAKFMIDVLPLWSIRLIAMVLTGFSATAFILAAWRYQHLHLKVSHLEVDALPVNMIRGLSVVLACTSMIAFGCFCIAL